MFTKLVANRVIQSTASSLHCSHVLRHNQLLKTWIQLNRCLKSSSKSFGEEKPILDKRRVIQPKTGTSGRSVDHLKDLDLNDKEMIDLLATPKINALEEPDPELLDGISPVLPLSFNLAAYANKSETIQMLVKLGVDLAFLEKKMPQMAEYLLRLDFETDIKPYIHFLVDNGVKPNELGVFFTGNPWFFGIHLDDLQIRVNYMRSKKFDKQMMASILTKCPIFLNYSTKQIDTHLAVFKSHFHLTADELRALVTSYPKIALMFEPQYEKMSFIFTEEFGFNSKEIKQMLLTYPLVFRIIVSQRKMHRIYVKVFDLVHNQMKIPHELIAKFPQIFSRRLIYIEWRHMYLKKLGRDQYDPKLPLYVPLSAFYLLEDNEFCEKYAKTSVNQFNAFLKTL